VEQSATLGLGGGGGRIKQEESNPPQKQKARRIQPSSTMELTDGDKNQH
jgi:hypothetical protein